MTRLAPIGREVGRWLDEAAVPVIVFLLFALFARGLPWILATVADGEQALRIEQAVSRG